MVILGIGYLLDGEYYPIPANAELVLENPEVPIANSPLSDDAQMKRTARDPAWRHIGKFLVVITSQLLNFRSWKEEIGPVFKAAHMVNDRTRAIKNECSMLLLIDWLAAVFTHSVRILFISFSF
jgi:hypothetical protein